MIDWTGRAIRNDKRGAIDEALHTILKRLSIDSEAWQAMMQPGKLFGRAIGPVNHLMLHAKSLGQQWVQELWQAERIY